MKTIYEALGSTQERIIINGYIANTGTWNTQDCQIETKDLILIMEDSTFKYYLRIKDSLQQNILYRKKKID